MLSLSKIINRKYIYIYAFGYLILIVKLDNTFDLDIFNYPGINLNFHFELAKKIIRRCLWILFINVYVAQYPKIKRALPIVIYIESSLLYG